MYGGEVDVVVKCNGKEREDEVGAERGFTPAVPSASFGSFGLYSMLFAAKCRSRDFQLVARRGTLGG